MILSNFELKRAILEFLMKKGRWGANYFPLQTLINWFSKKVERDGKRVKEILKQLLHEELLLIYKKGKVVSLNPHKKEEILKIITT